MNLRSITRIGKNRRGIEPALGAIAIMAIALAGSSGVMIYSEDMFRDYPEDKVFELISVTGYDTRDAETIILHDGNFIQFENCCEIMNGEKSSHEKIGIYLKNLSEEPIRIKKLIVAGNEYSFVKSEITEEWNQDEKPGPGEFIIITGKYDGEFIIVQGSHAAILPGETVTLLTSLTDSLAITEAAPVVITTSNGNTFLSGLEVGKLRQ